MNVSAHQIPHGGIHHLVALADRHARESLRHDPHPEVPTLAGARMTGMQRTIVADLELQRVERARERISQPFDAAARRSGLDGFDD